MLNSDQRSPSVELPPTCGVTTLVSGTVPLNTPPSSRRKKYSTCEPDVNKPSGMIFSPSNRTFELAWYPVGTQSAPTPLQATNAGTVPSQMKPWGQSVGSLRKSGSAEMGRPIRVHG